MKIELKKLSSEINEFKDYYDPDDLGLGTEELKYNSVGIKVKAKYSGNKIFVEGEYNCEVEIECVRCLKKFDDILRNSFSFEYEIPKEEKYIDITEDVRDEIILNYPKKPLCKEECKGLCQWCGKNLNISDCDCKGEELDSFNPFSELANKFEN